MDGLISGGLKTGGGELKVGFYGMSTETQSLLPATICWDFQMFDAQRLKIKTVIVNSSSHMRVTRAYFFSLVRYFVKNIARKLANRISYQIEMFRRGIKICDGDLSLLAVLDQKESPNSLADVGRGFKSAGGPKWGVQIRCDAGHCSTSQIIH